MRNIILAAAITIAPASAFATSKPQQAYNAFIAQGYGHAAASAEASAVAAATGLAWSENHNVAASGGNTLSVTGDEAAAASAIAPTVIHGNAAECYWTFTLAAAAQSTGGGGSAGAGLFPVRLTTCMKFMLADRYASGAATHPEAARLLREIEASLK